MTHYGPVSQTRILHREKQIPYSEILLAKSLILVSYLSLFCNITNHSLDLIEDDDTVNLQYAIRRLSGIKSRFKPPTQATLMI